MELKEFIRETLAQIAAGVEAAQTEVRDAGGFVNPAHRPLQAMRTWREQKPELFVRNPKKQAALDT